MHDFLNFAFKNFRVGIWTSNMRHNAEATVNIILNAEQKKQLSLLWARENCILGANYSSKKFINQIYDSGIVSKNTKVYMVDDSPEKIHVKGKLANFTYLPIVSYNTPHEKDIELLKLKSTLLFDE